jgi:hypothetical protein
VRQVVAIREPDQKFDWSKTWVAEMFLSEMLDKEPQHQSLGSGYSSEFIPSSLSVTEGTTKHLSGPDQER